MGPLSNVDTTGAAPTNGGSIAPNADPAADIAGADSSATQSPASIDSTDSAPAGSQPPAEGSGNPGRRSQWPRHPSHGYAPINDAFRSGQISQPDWQHMRDLNDSAQDPAKSRWFDYARGASPAPASDSPESGATFTISSARFAAFIKIKLLIIPASWKTISGSRKR